MLELIAPFPTSSCCPNAPFLYSVALSLLNVIVSICHELVENVTLDQFRSVSTLFGSANPCSQFEFHCKAKPLYPLIFDTMYPLVVVSGFIHTLIDQLASVNAQEVSEAFVRDKLSFGLPVVSKSAAFPWMPVVYPTVLLSVRVLEPLLSALSPEVSSNFQ